ncbi:30S ribosome-binding factor RbfA [Mycoplasma sp. Mirounga ES2805-ORL]|uniref:30S ribosome-binding factor RbfA n=1 Tax=Mycoplasma sp. Mirounga ES2805-ORL TaxID=754514 RepID=UPI00197B0773|nr:30S ribosome-binding factor RbfA [Mycoplasma sp. Mirounga ES2805-ORL]QSF13556.1 30S ribosome-binding factor RbfA [Mycoplasma sp. Mirounga ES2805-ORL]
MSNNHKSINNLRREEQIKQLISSILINDFRNSNVFNPVVIDCDLTNDLSEVKVYVTFSEKSQKGIEVLNDSRNYFKKIISKTLDWRKVPNIIFILDEITNQGMKIDSILNNIKKEDINTNGKVDFKLSKTELGTLEEFKLQWPYLQINIWEIQSISKFLKNDFSEENKPVYYLLNKNKSSEIILANSTKLKSRKLFNRGWFTHNKNNAFQIVPGDGMIKILEIRFDKKNLKMIDQYEINNDYEIDMKLGIKKTKRNNIENITSKNFWIKKFTNVQDKTIVQNCYILDLSTENLYFFSLPKEIYFHDFIMFQKK